LIQAIRVLEVAAKKLRTALLVMIVWMVSVLLHKTKAYLVTTRVIATYMAVFVSRANVSLVAQVLPAQMLLNAVLEFVSTQVKHLKAVAAVALTVSMDWAASVIFAQVIQTVLVIRHVMR
jgi:hypothetical protein